LKPCHFNIISTDFSITYILSSHQIKSDNQFKLLTWITSFQPYIHWCTFNIFISKNNYLDFIIPSSINKKECHFLQNNIARKIWKLTIKYLGIFFVTLAFLISNVKEIWKWKTLFRLGWVVICKFPSFYR
jgi:hypothetical protein